KQTDIPPFIDIAPYCFKKENKAITDYLKRNTFLSDNQYGLLSKRALQEQLLKDPEFSHLVIPTHKVNSFEDMQYHLEKYSKVVLKPLGGLQGKGIYVLEKIENGYLLGHKFRGDQLNEDELEEFFKHSIAKKGYIRSEEHTSELQSRFDLVCRLLLEKKKEHDQ